jgi:hypothetical protein
MQTTREHCPKCNRPIAPGEKCHCITAQDIYQAALAYMRSLRRRYPDMPDSAIIDAAQAVIREGARA